MPTNGQSEGLFYGINGIPIFTYGMIGITTLVLAYITMMDIEEPLKLAENSADNFEKITGTPVSELNPLNMTGLNNDEPDQAKEEPELETEEAEAKEAEAEVEGEGEGEPAAESEGEGEQPNEAVEGEPKGESETDQAKLGGKSRKKTIKKSKKQPRKKTRSNKRNSKKQSNKTIK